MSGETYRGTAFVVNAWYLTQYRPIKDTSGKVIGCLYVGILQEGVEQLRQAFKNVKLGQTGFLTVFGGSGSSEGIIKMHKDDKAEGTNILDETDASGQGRLPGPGRQGQGGGRQGGGPSRATSSRPTVPVRPS